MRRNSLLEATKRLPGVDDESLELSNCCDSDACA
jgi:hypothetical protein